jgi:hypothetical protein
MKQNKVWDEFTALPPELQRQAADFILFLRTRQPAGRPGKASKRAKLGNEPFIGMWQDHQELSDSTGWVRKLRRRDWFNPDA